MKNRLKDLYGRNVHKRRSKRRANKEDDDLFQLSDDSDISEDNSDEEDEKRKIEKIEIKPSMFDDTSSSSSSSSSEDEDDDDVDDISNIVKKFLDEEDDDIPEESKFVENYRTEVKKIEEKMLEVRRSVGKLSFEYQKLAGSIFMTRRKKRIEEIRTGIKEDLNDIKVRLENIERGNVKIFREIRSGTNDRSKRICELHMRKNFYYLLLKKFADVIVEYHKVENTHNEGQKIELDRRKKIVQKDGEVSNERERGIESVDPRRIFLKSLKGVPTIHVEYSLELERKKKLMKLNSEMNEIVDMFSDLHAFVKMQRKYVDSIERNILQAQKYTESGKKMIEKARKRSIGGGVKKLLFVPVKLLFG